jgi:hypothetical protein
MTIYKRVHCSFYMCIITLITDYSFCMFSLEFIVFNLFEFFGFWGFDRNVIKSFQVMSCIVVELKATVLDTALSPSS